MTGHAAEPVDAGVAREASGSVSGLLRRGSFARSLLTLFSGSAAAQALTFAAAPLLARLYSPEDFGIYSLYVTILGLSAPVVSGRYEMAIVTAKGEDEATGLLALSWTLAVLFGAALALPIALSGETLAHWLGIEALAPHLWILPASVAVSGIAEAARFAAIRAQSFRRISASQVAQSGMAATTQVAAGIGPLPGGWGLLTGQFLGIGVAAVVLALGSAGRVATWIRNAPGGAAPALGRVAVRHRRHPLYLPWGGLLDALGQRLPVLMLAVFYGPHFLGFYALADRLLKAPVSVVGQAASQVLFRKMTQADARGRMDRYVGRWAFCATVASVGPFLLLLIAGPELFARLLGPDWEASGRLAALLVPYFWGVVAVSPVSTLLVVADRQGLLLTIQLGFLVCGFGALWLGHHLFGSGEGTVLIFALTQGGVYLAYLIALLRVARGVRVAA